VSRKRRQELSLDGIDTSLTMTAMTYSRLHEAVLRYSEATTQSDSTSDLQNLILLDAWSLIDITNRVRVLVGQTPGLKHSAAVKSFLRATKDVEGLRNYIQHLPTEVMPLAETGWPIWGALSWIWTSPEMQKVGTTSVLFIVAGRLAKSRGYPMVNPAGKTIRLPVDHICLSAADRAVNLSQITRRSE
jgi:hypothetical protein